MYGAWALLKRQYGRLQCLSSVGLLFRIYMVCLIRRLMLVRCGHGPIALAEIGLMCPPDQWLLRAATFWNVLAALPPGSLYKQMAVDACAWASSMSGPTSLWLLGQLA